MKAIQLINSFMKQARWGQLHDDGRPFQGVKWLTVKQINFLYSLCRREDPQGIDFFDNFTWHIDGYKAQLSKKMSNGCRQIIFTNTYHKKTELTEEQTKALKEYEEKTGTKIL